VGPQEVLVSKGQLLTLVTCHGEMVPQIKRFKVIKRLAIIYLIDAYKHCFLTKTEFIDFADVPDGDPYLK
jgi:hypothetical protein